MINHHIELTAEEIDRIDCLWRQASRPSMADVFARCFRRGLVLEYLEAVAAGRCMSPAEHEAWKKLYEEPKS